jgi:hypothetical protein
MEMIDFQHDNFGSQIEAEITNIYKKLDENPNLTNAEVCKSQEMQNILDIITRRTGLFIKVVEERKTRGACIVTFTPNTAHIFLRPEYRGFYSQYADSFMKGKENRKGFVDLQNARVSGIFSEIPNILIINIDYYKTRFKMSPGEVTAVILHELGHAFTSCEFSHRIDSTNQVLNNIAKKLSDKHDQTTLEYVYKELKSLDDNTSEEVAKAIVSGNKIIAGYAWTQFCLGYLGVSDSSNDIDYKYNRTSSEQTADSFANRFGYGRLFVTGLDKTYVKNLDQEKYSDSYFYAMTLMELMGIILSGALATAASPWLVVFGTMCLSSWVRSAIGSTVVNSEMTYDTLKHRYLRIRNDLVELLKNTDLDKDLVKQTLSDIYVLDGIVKDTRDVWSLGSALFNKIGVNRKINKSIQYEQLLEELAHNNLFVKAAQLQTI